MALILVRLRLLIAGRARGNGPGSNLYYVVSWVVGIAFGLMSGLATAVFVSGGEIGDAIVLGAFVVISLPWLMGPILEPSLADGTVDPRRLEQFPLTSSQQVVGLLTGAMIAPTATFTFLFAAGATAALGMSLTARLAALLSSLIFVVMCVAVSRSAQALLTESLRSRRGRDFAAFLASLMVLGLYAVSVHLRSTIASLNDQLTGPIGQLVAWVPPGAAAQSIIDARDGYWLDYGLRLSIMVAMTLAATLGWKWALERRVRGETTGPGRGYRRSRLDPTPLVPRLLSVLPSTPSTAALSQQWRYFFFRSPKAIQTLIIPPVMGVMVAHTTFGTSGVPAQTAAFAALAIVVGSFNVFGYDGAGFRYLISSGVPLSAVLRGKAVTPLLYLVPLMVAFSTIECSLRGTWSQLVPALLVGLAVLLTGVGIGAQSSVLNPSDQSRVGHRQGMFLKVFAWFSGFFVVVSLGAATWMLIARGASELVASVFVLLASAAVCVGLVLRAGHHVDRNPDDLLRRLNPATF
ncbi:MAG TPA: hypothetical protein DCM67_08750 [Propionibacteriaceae bacterium]|nr:hypothetical protein [Propionibacteriaceae bacterium]